MSTSSCSAELVSIGPLPLTWPRVATLAATRGHPPLSLHSVRLSGRLRQVRKSCSVAVAADLLTQEAGGLRRFASPAFPQSTSSRCAELVSCGPLPLLVSADGHAPGPLATKASDIPLCFSPVSPPPVRLLVLRCPAVSAASSWRAASVTRPAASDFRTIDRPSLDESSNPSDKVLRGQCHATEWPVLRDGAPSTLIFRR